MLWMDEVDLVQLNYLKWKIIKTTERYRIQKTEKLKIE